MPEKTALITALILDRPMCLDCIATKAGMSGTEAEAIIRAIAAVLELHREPARCRACGTSAPVLSLERPGDDPVIPRPAPPQADRPLATSHEALWRFLESHRGEMFCTRCIASALGARGRLDRAILGAEGRGAQRRHGACSRCGKDRLLCGLTR